MRKHKWRALIYLSPNKLNFNISRNSKVLPCKINIIKLKLFKVSRKYQRHTCTWIRLARNQQLFVNGFNFFKFKNKGFLSLQNWQGKKIILNKIVTFLIWKLFNTEIRIALKLVFWRVLKVEKFFRQIKRYSRWNCNFIGVQRSFHVCKIKIKRNVFQIQMSWTFWQ